MGPILLRQQNQQTEENQQPIKNVSEKNTKTVKQQGRQNATLSCTTLSATDNVSENHQYDGFEMNKKAVKSNVLRQRKSGKLSDKVFTSRDPYTLPKTTESPTRYRKYSRNTAAYWESLYEENASHSTCYYVSDPFPPLFSSSSSRPLASKLTSVESGISVKCRDRQQRRRRRGRLRDALERFVENTAATENATATVGERSCNFDDVKNSSADTTIANTANISPITDSSTASSKTQFVTSTTTNFSWPPSFIRQNSDYNSIHHKSKKRMSKLLLSPGSVSKKSDEISSWCSSWKLLQQPSAIRRRFKKLYRNVTSQTMLLLEMLLKKRLLSPVIWLIGLLIAITILPNNLANASSMSSSFSGGSFSSSEEHYGLNLSDKENSSYEDESIDDSNATEKTPLFPKDLFTREQLKNGAVILHVIGVIYMFVALAVVCDEFFVPSLDVIIEKLGITDDVAGATFMAAGGSAPELFTSVIGVFVSFDDVGIGTIVGSAVFNILFVIGMCALFSKTVLTLTWWPLFRDCSFYSISLMTLIYFFRDNLIYWWEALVLFFIYAAYVGFMKWNQQVERCVKKVIYKNKVTRVRSTDQLMPAGNAANSSETSMATQPGGSVTSRAASESRSGPQGSSSGATGNSSANAGSTVTGAKFRHGLLQLMIHTIDPLHDADVPGKVDEKATQLHAIASLKVLLDATKPQRGAATTSAANHVKINLKETTLASDRPNGNIDTTIDSPSVGGRRASWIEQRVKLQTRRFSTKGNELEEEPEALSMAWPDTGRKRITYLLVAPIIFPLWLTLPDTRTPRGKKYFPVTFIGSIVWIAAYSYLMVWWANIIGDTAGIPPEVMGLTFLAAGTSIPDLITSVIVARKGFGDMAVSSSVGSNIFDVTVGLPIPWLLYGIIYQEPVQVNSVGMVCSITILFMMLLFVVLSIACFRWRMNKGLGLTMFVLYFVFVAVSLMFEYKTLTCPF